MQKTTNPQPRAGLTRVTYDLRAALTLAFRSEARSAPVARNRKAALPGATTRALAQQRADLGQVARSRSLQKSRASPSQASGRLASGRPHKVPAVNGERAEKADAQGWRVARTTEQEAALARGSAGVGRLSRRGGRAARGSRVANDQVSSLRRWRVESRGLLDTHTGARPAPLTRRLCTWPCIHPIRRGRTGPRLFLLRSGAGASAALRTLVESPL